MAKLISIYNPLSVEFSFRWDGQLYYLPPKKTIQLEDYLANHGAKHLVDYIILHSETWAEGAPERSKLAGPQQDNVTVQRDPILAGIILGEFDPTQPTTSGAVGEEDAEGSEEKPKAKRGRPPKKAEKEFEDAEKLK